MTLQQDQNPTETESRPGESMASSKQLIVSLHLIEPHPMKAVILTQNNLNNKLNKMI